MNVTEIQIGDNPQSWAAAGFELAADTCVVGTVRIRFVGPEAGRGVRCWALDSLVPETTDIDGLVTGNSPASAPAASAPHPNGVISIDHLVLVSSNGERTAAAISAATGLDVRRIRDTGTDASPMRQWFFRMGAMIIELVAPAEPGPEETAASLFGVAFNVEDIDATAAFYGPHLSRVKDAVQPGRRIASLRHSQYDISLPVAFMTPHPPRGRAEPSSH